MIYYFETNSTNPFYNLAFEEYLFRKKPAGDLYVMLWQNKDTVVVGKHQNIFEEVNLAYAKEQGIKVVRRNSGGGSVFHDLGNLNYTWIMDRNGPYDVPQFARPILQALQQLGVAATFTGRNDICVNEYKISGTAQYVQQSKILHHGTLLVNSNLEKMSRVLRPGSKITHSQARPSHRSRVCNLADCVQGGLPIELIKKTILAQFEKIKSAELSAEETAEIRLLQKNKYETRSWNEGFMPACNFTNKKRFAGGTVQVQAFLQAGKIKSIRFLGDFFADKNIQELEEKLKGLSLTEDLGEKLKQCHVESYIRGVTAEDLFSLFDTFQ